MTPIKGKGAQPAPWLALSHLYGAKLWALRVRHLRIPKVIVVVMYLFPFLFNLFPLPCGCLDCVETFILTINWPNRSDREMLGFGRARTKSFRWLLRSKTKLPKREGVHLIMLSCYYSHVVTGTQRLASTRGVLT